MRWPTFDQHGDGMLMCCIDVAAMPVLCCLIRWLTDANRERRRPRTTGVDDRRPGPGEVPSCVDSQNWTGRRRAQFRGECGSSSAVDQIRPSRHRHEKVLTACGTHDANVLTYAQIGRPEQR